MSEQRLILFHSDHLSVLLPLTLLALPDFTQQQILVVGMPLCRPPSVPKGVSYVTLSKWTADLSMTYTLLVDGGSAEAVTYVYLQLHPSVINVYKLKVGEGRQVKVEKVPCRD